MGRVWRARDEMLHREVAVKEIVPAQLVGRRRTGRVALAHPAGGAHRSPAQPPRTWSGVYDVVTVDGSPWIVMEYVPSRIVAGRCWTPTGRSTGPRGAGSGWRVLGRAARRAHRRGAAPRRQAAERAGRPRRAGDAHRLRAGHLRRRRRAMTRPGMVLGSPQFVAPERAAEGVSSVEADLWSLGATLHAAVEGRSPYARSTAMATLSALATGPPDPAPHAGPLAPVLDGLLRRDPRDRLDHDAARRLLRAAATGRADPPSAADRRSADGPVPGLVDRSADDPDDQDPTIPLPDPDTLAAAGGACPRRRPRIRQSPGVPRAGWRWSPWRCWSPSRPASAPRWPSTGDEPPRHRRLAHHTAAERSARRGAPVRPRPGPPPGGGTSPRPRSPCVRPDVVGCARAGRSPNPGERIPAAARLGRGTSTPPASGSAVPATWLTTPATARWPASRTRRTGRTLSVSRGGAADPLVRLPARSATRQPGRGPAGVRRDPARRLSTAAAPVGVPLADPVRRPGCTPGNRSRSAHGPRGRWAGSTDDRDWDQGRLRVWDLGQCRNHFPTTDP